MSQRNVEVVREWIDAYNRRDNDALIGLNDPDFEFRSIFVSIESVFRGVEAFPYAYFKTLDDAYEEFVLVPSDFVDVGAAVLVVGNVEWRGKESGAPGQTPIVPVFWLRAGKVFREETFTDLADALEAVGLSGADLTSTKPNVELSRELVEAVAQQDADRLVELTDPEVEWHSFFAQLGEGGVYLGHEGMRRYMSDLMDAWERWRFYEHGVLAVDDLVLMVGHFAYRGRDSGIETTSPPAGVLVKFRDGKAIYMRSWRDPAQALEAAARAE
jgi:ketosteroid isomerase-like protein